MAPGASPGLAITSAARSAASRRAWLAPSPTGGIRWAASPTRVSEGCEGQRIPGGVTRISRLTTGSSAASTRAVRVGDQSAYRWSTSLRPAGRHGRALRTIAETRTRPLLSRWAVRFWSRPSAHRPPWPTRRARSGRVRSTSGIIIWVYELRYVVGIGEPGAQQRPAAVGADQQVALTRRAIGQTQPEPAAGSLLNRDDLGAPVDRCGRQGSSEQVTQVGAVDLRATAGCVGDVVHEQVPGRAHDLMFLSLGAGQGVELFGEAGRLEGVLPGLGVQVEGAALGAGVRSGIPLVDAGLDAVDMQDPGERETGQAGPDDGDAHGSPPRAPCQAGTREHLARTMTVRSHRRLRQQDDLAENVALRGQ